MTEDKDEADKILAAEQDFEFTLSYEVLPPIELKSVKGIKVTREVVDISDDEVNEQVLKVAESARSYETKKGKAANGDRVTMDYVGKVDGEAFEGGTDQGAELVLGSGRFIPGFEDQLVGVKAGDEKTITVTFPADYPAKNLAGKEATFDVTVKDVAAPADVEINDELATKLGLEFADRLKEIVRGQIESPVRLADPPEGQAPDPRPARRDVQVRDPAVARRRRIQRHLEPGEQRSRSVRQDLRGRRHDRREGHAKNTRRSPSAASASVSFSPKSAKRPASK